MGCLWAAQLSDYDEVCFLTTRHDTSSTISFEFKSTFYTPTNNQFSFPIIPARNSNKIHTLLVCTKSYDALPALKLTQAFLNPDSNIVLFQNGLGSQMAIVDAFPSHKIFAAVTTEGANRPDQDTLIHAGAGLTQIGALSTTPDSDMSLIQVRQILSQSGMAIDKHDDIRQALWHKLAINCAINPYTALLNCENGKIRNSELFQSTWPLLLKELTAALSLAGHAIEEAQLEAMVLNVTQRTAQNISSMLQDVRANRKTEIDDINGYVSKFLASKKHSNTINSMLWKQVMSLSKSRD